MPLGDAAGPADRRGSAPRWRRLLAWAPALTLMAAISFLSHQPEWPEAAQGFPDWLLHGGAYALLTLLNWVGLTCAGFQRTTAAHVLWALLGASAFGALDEVHQGFVPGRQASALDWVADSAGAVVAALVLLARARR